MGGILEKFVKKKLKIINSSPSPKKENLSEVNKDRVAPPTMLNPRSLFTDKLTLQTL
jgi:hypothetical protein